MNQGQWDVRKKANDSRLKKICDRLERFDPEFKVWAEESKNLARAERRLNNSDPLYGAVASGSFGSQVTRKPLTGAQLNPLAFSADSLRKMFKPFQSREHKDVGGGRSRFGAACGNGRRVAGTNPVTRSSKFSDVRVDVSLQLCVGAALG